MTTGSASPGWPVEGRPVIRRAPGAQRSGPSLRAGLLHDGGDVRTTHPHGPGHPDADERRRLGARLQLEELRPLLLWVACLVVAVVAFGALGRTAMASPPVTAPAQWWSWAQQSSADLIAFNLLRIIGVALAWYLLGVTAVGAFARVVAWGGLVRVADVLTVGPVRTLLQHALGATLAVSAAAAMPGSALTASFGAREAPVTITVQGQRDQIGIAAVPGAREQRVVAGSAGQPDVVIPERSLRPDMVAPRDSWSAMLGDDLDRPRQRKAVPAVQESEEMPAGPSTESVTGERATHTIAPGDHFWAIAQETLGHEANEEEVMDYWTRLVDANRDRLVVPGNPDLLLPGQVIVLPDAHDAVVS